MEMRKGNMIDNSNNVNMKERGKSRDHGSRKMKSRCTFFLIIFWFLEFSFLKVDIYIMVILRRRG